MKLIATKKLTYNTRHLVAGDPFEARDRDARLLIGIRKAKAAEAPQRRRYQAPPVAATAPAPALTPAPEVVALPDDDELTRLRKTARRLGIIVDKRWGSQTLRDRIARVQG